MWASNVRHISLPKGFSKPPFPPAKVNAGLLALKLHGLPLVELHAGVRPAVHLTTHAIQVKIVKKKTVLQTYTAI